MPTDQAQYYKANPDKMMRGIERVLGNQEMALVTEFQAAIWTSVTKSAELHKTWLAPDLAALEKKVRSKFNGAPNIENSILNGRKLIRAAATGEPLKVSGRPAMAVNVAMAKQVLSGLNGSLDRARRLFNPVWKK